MITDISEIETFIKSLLDINGNITTYAILVRVVSYANEQHIEIPNMYDPNNSEIAMDEIEELRKNYVEAEIP